MATEVPVENGPESDDDENEVVEESPDKRYQKRKQEVTQRDVPGIEVAYLAMDAEEGVEVVWNEVMFSKKNTYKEQAEKIAQTFNNLILFKHPNIVKFHKWWPDFKHKKARVIFITEYITSGSLKRFLINSRKNKKPIKSKQWKKWFRQILSALCYLHSSEPPVIHGNLSCDTVFIQHTGLVKIGCVAPDLINEHVRTFSASKFSHIFLAPEYATGTTMSTAVDIYAFGICALTMLCEDSHIKLLEQNRIQEVVNCLQDSDVKHFIQICVDSNPEERPTARQLLFHSLLFEVPSLKQLSCHAICKNRRTISESAVESEISSTFPTDYVIAETHANDPLKIVKATYADSECRMQDLEKYLEDFQNGVYPLTAFKSQDARVTGKVCSLGDKGEQAETKVGEPTSNYREPYDVENRRIKIIKTKYVTQIDEDKWRVELLIKFTDMMYRELHCDFSDRDTSLALATELVFFGLINHRDLTVIAHSIEEEWKGRHSPLSYNRDSETKFIESLTLEDEKTPSSSTPTSSMSDSLPINSVSVKTPEPISEKHPKSCAIPRPSRSRVSVAGSAAASSKSRGQHNVPVVATGFPAVPGWSHAAHPRGVVGGGGCAMASPAVGGAAAAVHSQPPGHPAGQLLLHPQATPPPPGTAVYMLPSQQYYVLTPVIAGAALSSTTTLATAAAVPAALPVAYQAATDVIPTLLYQHDTAPPAAESMETPNETSKSSGC